MILIDSDVLIEVSRARNAEILERWQELRNSRVTLAYSPVSLAELWSGAFPREYSALQDLFDLMACLDADYAVGVYAGRYLNEFRKSHRLELFDVLIAATARAHQIPLWTRNRKHYPMSDISFL